MKRLDHYRATVWHDPDLTGPDKLVLLAVAEFMDFDTLAGARPGSARLARMSSMDARSVKRVMRRLVASNWLTVTHTGGSARGGSRLAATYRGTIPTGDPESPVMAATGDLRSPEPVTLDPPTGDLRSPHPLRDRRRPDGPPAKAVDPGAGNDTPRVLATSANGHCPPDCDGRWHLQDGGAVPCPRSTAPAAGA